jgi:hypothetical protein
LPQRAEHPGEGLADEVVGVTRSGMAPRQPQSGRFVADAELGKSRLVALACLSQQLGIGLC